MTKWKVYLTLAGMGESPRTDVSTRAAFVDGFPVVILGEIALALGSNPDQTGSQKAWWLAVTAVFALTVAWVLVRAFRRADEYLRRVQLESMAVAFAAVLVSLQLAMVLGAADVVGLRGLIPLILIGGLAVWLVIADLRTRLHR